MRARILFVVGLCAFVGAGTAEAVNHYVCWAASSTAANDCGVGTSSDPDYTTLQAALNAANPGDTIYLKANETFAGAILPNKGPMAQPIVIRSSAPDAVLPAPGARLIPTSRVDGLPVSGGNTAPSNLPTIRSTSQSTAAIRTELGAQDYVFRFVRFTNEVQRGFGALVQLGYGADTANTQQFAIDQPQDITIDRCLFETLPHTGQKLAVQMNGVNLKVLNSFLAGFGGLGQDAICMGGANGWGPIEIVNNYCEGAAENIIFGGADPDIHTFVNTGSGSTASTINLNTSTFRAGHTISTLSVGQVVAVVVGSLREHRHVATIVDADTFTVDLPFSAAPAAGVDVRWGANFTNVTIERNHLTKPLSWKNPLAGTPTGVNATPSTASGTLGAGTYYYKISARVANAYQGNSFYSPPSAEVSATLGGTGQVILSWTAVPGATHYRVHGRATSAQDIYFETANTTFTDTGGAGTAGTPPDEVGTHSTANPRISYFQVKNLFELKQGINVTVRYNILENAWFGHGGTSAGKAAWLKSTNQDLSAEYQQTKNVLFAYNVMRNVGGCFLITSQEASGGTPLDRPAPNENMTIEHNLCYLSGDPNAASIEYAVSNGYQGAKSLTFRNNTIIHDRSGAWALEGSQPWAGTSTIRDNIFLHNTHGFKGPALTSGTPSIDPFIGQANFQFNVIDGGFTYPATTIRPTLAALTSAFKGDSLSAPDILDYELDNGHAWRTAGTGGGMIGANIVALDAFVSGVIGGGGGGGPTEETILTDNFNDNSFASAWLVDNAFSGTEDPTIPVEEVNQRLEIGPLLSSGTGSHYNAISSASGYAFTDAYAQVRLVQIPGTGLHTYTFFTIGINSTNYYRWFVNGTSLTAQRNIAGTKNDQSITYSATNHQYLRMRHEPVTGSSTGDVVWETGPAATGPWTTRRREAWNTTAIPLSSVRFEMKAGTDDPESPPPGTAIFDDFHAARFVGGGGFTELTLAATRDAGGSPIRGAAAPSRERNAVDAVASEVVLYASEAAEAPGWVHVSDGSAAGGVMLATPAMGTTWGPSAGARAYFDVPFQAMADTRYRVWVRMRAERENERRGAVYLQFSDTVDERGAPRYETESEEGLAVRLHDCSTCQAAGWGWRTPTGEIRFAQSGEHTVRVLVHEDGVQVDQIVISPHDYLATAPGRPSGDATVVARADSNPRPMSLLTGPADAATFAAGVPVVLRAAAADDEGVTRVDFYVSGVLEASRDRAPFEAVWTPQTAGRYDVTAVATDTRGARTSSPTSSVTIAAAPVADAVLARDDFADDAPNLAQWTSAPSGLVSSSPVDFRGAYAQVELVQPAFGERARTSVAVLGSGGAYRLVVHRNGLWMQQAIGAEARTLRGVAYDARRHRFLRIRHDATRDMVVFEAAPGNGGVPGVWRELHRTPWTAAVPLSSVRFGLTSETASGRSSRQAIFDSFMASRP